MKHRYEISFINKQAIDEYRNLDGSQKCLIDKGICKLTVRAESLGEPLSGNLFGCRRLKWRKEGLR